MAAGIAKNGKRSSPDRPTAPPRMGNHYPECGACQPVRQAADAPKLHTPSRACTSWEQREHKAAALRKIAFLAISEAHQVFHWLPAALCLARDFGVEVSVLSPSRKMLDFIGSYDEKCVLELVQLRRPFPSRDSLFRLPSRLAVLLLNYRRSEEHTSELQSLMRISYAVFCLTKTTYEHNQSIN